MATKSGEKAKERNQKRMSLLEIKNLHVTVGGHEILKGIDLRVDAGEVHSIMGPNGSGKSTLAQVLARRESYQVTEGEVLFNGRDLLAMKPEEAACEGVFMAFQYPVEIPGIGNAYFLRSALNAIRNTAAKTKWTPWIFCRSCAKSSSCSIWMKSS